MTDEYGYVLMDYDGAAVVIDNGEMLYYEPDEGEHWNSETCEFEPDEDDEDWYDRYYDDGYDERGHYHPRESEMDFQLHEFYSGLR